MIRNITDAYDHVDLEKTDTYVKCEFCLNSLPSHHPHCPLISGKQKEWEKGFNIGRSGHLMSQNMDPTAQVGWQIGNQVFDHNNLANI